MRETSKYFFYQLLVRDVKGKYAGYKSMWMWVFVEPLIIALIMYTVFRGMGKVDLFVNQAYALYFFTGYFSWILISMSVTEATTVFRQYSSIFKKVSVNMEVFPLLKIVKHFLIFVFLNAVGLIFLISDIVNFEFIKLIGFVLALLITVGLAVYVSAAVSALSRGFEELVKLFVRFGLWVLPVIWLPGVMSSKLVFLSQLTPFYYLLALFRDSIGIEIEYGISLYSWLAFLLIMTVLVLRLRYAVNNMISELV